MLLFPTRHNSVIYKKIYGIFQLFCNTVKNNRRIFNEISDKYLKTEINRNIFLTIAPIVEWHCTRANRVAEILINAARHDSKICINPIHIEEAKTTIEIQVWKKRKGLKNVFDMKYCSLWMLTVLQENRFI